MLKTCNICKGQCYSFYKIKVTEYYDEDIIHEKFYYICINCYKSSYNKYIKLFYEF